MDSKDTQQVAALEPWELCSVPRHSSGPWLLVRAILASVLFLLGCESKATQADQRPQSVEASKSYEVIEPFEVTSIDGAEISIGAGSDRVTLVYLFATWCDTCSEATQELKKEFPGTDDRVQVVAVGREHGSEELRTWAQDSGVQFQVVADPERKIYSKFAEEYVPRLYVIDAKGQILHDTVGWFTGTAKQAKKIARKHM